MSSQFKTCKDCPILIPKGLLNRCRSCSFKHEADKKRAIFQKAKLERPEKREVADATLPDLKNKLWELLSEFVRRSAADWRGYVTCVTCPTVLPWQRMHAGHFIPGRHNAILFELCGVHPQCKECNVGLRGNTKKYREFMIKTYGAGVVEELERRDRANIQLCRADIEAKIADYRKKIKTL